METVCIPHTINENLIIIWVGMGGKTTFKKFFKVCLLFLTTIKGMGGGFGTKAVIYEKTIYYDCSWRLTDFMKHGKKSSSNKSRCEGSITEYGKLLVKLLKINILTSLLI